MTTHALDLNSFKTLKLDASFNPVAVIPAHEALVDTINPVAYRNMAIAGCNCPPESY
jgi:hypothetical protein